jgi:AcrR family transcriptional regulator
MAAKKTESAPDAAPRPRKRSPGRPAGLSQAAIVAAALELLTTCTTDELSFAKLADYFGVAPMTLYNYFPNRDALLNAVADHAFSLLKLPKARAGQSWQEQLLAWLWALQRHCKQHPVVFKVMGFEGGLSAAWLAATAPVYRILRALGWEGRELAQVSSWFMADAMGLIIADALLPTYRRPPALAHLEKLDADAQAMHLTLRKDLIDIPSGEWLEFGFRRLLAGLEQIAPA